MGLLRRLRKLVKKYVWKPLKRALRRPLPLLMGLLAPALLGGPVGLFMSVGGATLLCGPDQGEQNQSKLRKWFSKLMGGRKSLATVIREHREMIDNMTPEELRCYKAKERLKHLEKTRDNPFFSPLGHKKEYEHTKRAIDAFCEKKE